MNKIITVIGLGNVGRTVVQHLLAMEATFTINVIDPSEAVEGTFLDLAHSNALEKRHQLTWNDEYLLKRSDFVFHTAGPYFELGASRLSVANESIALTYQIFGNIGFEKTPYIIVISNPVDVITYHTWRASGLPAEYIIGTGTYLDTIRFEHYLAEHFQVALPQVSGLVLGEHGRSAVPILSQTHIEGEDLSHHIGLVGRAKYDVVNAAYNIRKTQGATMFGVSVCAIEILKALLGELNLEAPLSIVLDERNQAKLQQKHLAISVPTKIEQGKLVQYSLEGLPDNEIEQLRCSARVVAEHLNINLYDSSTPEISVAAMS